MHNKRQGSTGRSRKKGYKLKLSKGQAHVRSVKGWQTRHAHGWHTAAHVADHHGRLAVEDPFDKAKRRAAEHLMEGEGFADLSPSEIEDRLREEGLISSTQHRYNQEEDRWERLKVQDHGKIEEAKQTYIEEQRALAEHLAGADITRQEYYKHLTDTQRAELRRQLLSQVSPSLERSLENATPQEKAAFRAGIVKMQRQQERERKYRKIRARVGGHTVGGEYTGRGDTTDISYLEEDSRQREVMHDLHPLRNFSFTRGTTQFEVDPQHEVTPINPERTRERAQNAVRKVFHPMNPARDLERPPKSQEELKARMKQAGRLDLVKGLTAELDGKDVPIEKAIVEHIVRSHHSPDPDVRRASFYESERLINRSAVEANKRYEHARDVADMARIEDVPLFRARGEYAKKAPGPDPFATDLRSKYTIEDLYSYSGHHNRYKGAFRDQFNFSREQKRRRAKGIKEGNTFLGFQDGHATAIHSRNQYKVTGAILPNKQYEVTRQDADSYDPDTKQHKAPYKQYMEFFDKDTKFNEGQRDSEGRLLEGQIDELVGMKVVPKYNKTLNYLPGQKKLKGQRLPKPEGIVDEISYVPVVGANGTRTITMDHPNKTKRVYRVREPGRRVYEEIDPQKGTTREVKSPGVNSPWRVVEKHEYDQYDSNNRSVVQAPAKVKYVFADPKMIEQAEGSTDTLDLKLPHLPVYDRFGKPVLDERVVRLNLHPHTRREAIFGPYVRERQAVSNMRKTAKAEDLDQAQEHLKNYYGAMGLTGFQPGDGMDERGGNYEDTIQPQVHRTRGFRTAEEGKIWAAAATAAGYETSKKMARERAKLVGNKAFTRLGKVAPFNKIPNWDDELLTLNRAYLRPAQEKAANFGYSLKHPLSSPSGVTGGIDWGRPYYRTHFISDDKIATRRLNRISNDVERIARTRDSLRGRTGPLARHRLEALERHPDYRDFNAPGGFLKQRFDIARQMRDAEVGTKLSFKDPYSLEHMELPVTSSSKEAAASLMERLKGTAKSQYMADLRRPLTDDFHMNTHGLVFPSPTGKQVAIAGGAAAAVVGAHYAYFKYQQHKLAPEDRTAYYNKILPPGLTVPTFHVRTTGKVPLPNNAFTREFGMDKMKLPVRFGASIGKKKIGLRPMDRGYDANLPIGITGFRPHTGGTRGGSLAKSLAFYPTDPLRKSFKRGTHEVNIRGHKLPGTLQIGGFKPTKLSPTNPNRMNNHDREDIIWATKGTSMEGELKKFYSSGERVDPIIDMFNDPDLLKRIEKRKGPRFGERSRDKLMPAGQRQYFSNLTERASGDQPRWAGERAGFNYTTGEVRAAVDAGVHTDLTARFADAVRGTRHAPGPGGPFEAEDVRRNRPGQR